MKALYIVLGFVFLVLGIVGVVVPILPTVPFLLLTLFFFAKGSDRLHQWFLQTTIYQKHLKTFQEQRAMSKKSKFWILGFVTIMLTIGFIFTPVIWAKVLIVALLLVKYWFFFFKIKNLDEETA